MLQQGKHEILLLKDVFVAGIFSTGFICRLWLDGSCFLSWRHCIRRLRGRALQAGYCFAVHFLGCVVWDSNRCDDTKCHYYGRIDSAQHVMDTLQQYLGNRLINELGALDKVLSLLCLIALLVYSFFSPSAAPLSLSAIQRPNGPLSLKPPADDFTNILEVVASVLRLFRSIPIVLGVLSSLTTRCCKKN